MSSRHKAGGTLALLVTTVVCLAMLFPACGRKSAQPSQSPAVPVSAATVAQKNVPVALNAVGNIEAYNTVSVKAQIGGELTEVHFVEGQYVKKGDLLFTIDPRPYEIALKQAEATLAKDAAQLENARLDVRRYEEMAKDGIVSQEMYDRVLANATSLEAVVRADNALVDNARLQLKYCSIRSPLTGMVGSLMADQGNLIKANADTPMVVINQVQPIYVSFSVPEQYLPDIKKYMEAGDMKVEVTVAEGEEPIEGKLTFVDNEVNVTTGTIALKATFDNEEKQLWPGQFVTVTLILTTKSDAIIIASQAVQTGQQGEYVYVIKDDLTVESRPVTIAGKIGSETIVQEGLRPGERVVTDGQLRLAPGAKVEIKNGAATGNPAESMKQ